MKQCNRCSKEKDFSEFHKDKNTKDGFKNRCKECRKETDIIEYYLKFKDKILEQAAIYRKNNPNKFKEYYKNNPDYFFQYRESHSDHYKNWRTENSEKLREYQRNLRKTDINRRISCNLRSRLSGLIRKSKTKKIDSTMKLLGCSIEEFKIYISNKFKEGMSWENYGKWHLDHIIACAKFDLAVPENQQRCFHYTNLQPLWAKDNLRKNKY